MNILIFLWALAASPVWLFVIITVLADIVATILEHIREGRK